MKQLPIVVSKGFPCVGASLYSLHVPSGFGGRTRCEVNTSHVFLKGVLAAITLVGGGAGDGGARIRARCELELPFCDHHGPIRVGVRSQANVAEALRVGSELTLFPLSVVSPLSWHQHPHPRGKECWSKRGWWGYSGWVRVQAVVVQSQTGIRAASDALPV